MLATVLKGMAKNTSILMLQHTVTIGAGVVLMVFLPRYLGPVEYGRLYLAISLIGMFQILVNYGGSYLLAKDVSRSRENTAQLFVDALLLRLILAVVSLGAIYAITVVVGYPEKVKIIIIVYSTSLLVWAGTTTLGTCFQGHELLEYTAAGAAAERFFTTLVGVTLLLLGVGALGFAVVNVIGMALNLLVLARFSGRIIQSIPKYSLPRAFRQLKIGLPYFLFGIFSVIYYRIDSLMLSRMVPEAVVGSYGASYKLFESLNFPYLLTIAVYPILSRLWKEEELSHKQATQKSLEYVILLGIPISVGVLWFAREIVDILYGLPSFERSIILLRVLVGGLLLLYVNMVFGATLMSSDKQKGLMIVSLSTIPLNVGLNLVLIPYYQTHFGNGAIGAALATGLTEFCVMLAVVSLLPKGILKGFRIGLIPKSLLCGVAMTASLWLMNRLGWPLSVQALNAVVLYLTLLIVANVIEPAEKQFLQRSLKTLAARGFSRGLNRSPADHYSLDQTP